MLNDPIIEEIRRIRKELSEENDADLERIYHMALELQRKHTSHVVASTDSKDSSSSQNRVAA